MQTRHRIGLCGAVSAPFTQAASPFSVPPLNLETATVRVAPSPLPDEQSQALSFLEASQLRGRVLPFIVGVATPTINGSTLPRSCDASRNDNACDCSSGRGDGATLTVAVSKFSGGTLNGEAA